VQLFRREFQRAHGFRTPHRLPPHAPASGTTAPASGHHRTGFRTNTTTLTGKNAAEGQLSFLRRLTLSTIGGGVVITAHVRRISGDVTVHYNTANGTASAEPLYGELRDVKLEGR